MPASFVHLILSIGNWPGTKMASSWAKVVFFPPIVLQFKNSIGLPDSHLGIGLVNRTAMLRPLYADSVTRLHFLENSEANAVEIRRGNLFKALALNRGNRRPINGAYSFLERHTPWLTRFTSSHRCAPSQSLWISYINNRLSLVPILWVGHTHIMFLRQTVLYC